MDAVTKEFLGRFAAGAAETFTSDAERDAARLLSAHYEIGVTKDAGGDLIIAWFPQDADGDEDDAFADKLANLGGNVFASDIHLTVLYLGDPADYDVELLNAAVKLFTATRAYSIPGKVSGIGRFVGDGDQDCVVALVDSAGLDSFREYLCQYLCELGIHVGDISGHGYVPHFTIAYIPRQAASPPPLTETIDFKMDSLTVASGASRTAFDFGAYPVDAMSESTAPYFASREQIVKNVTVATLAEASAAAEALLALENAEFDADPVGMAEKLALARAEAERASDPLAKAEHVIGTDEPDMEHYITKTRPEERYTFGPLYAPDRADAHGEWTDAETLQKAVWDYVRSWDSNGRRINLQHDDSGDATIGECVEIAAWPYESTIKVRVPGEDDRELVMPAGTVYMGVVWDEDAWENGIKKGKLTGYSLGGRAVRVKAATPPDARMGDQIAPFTPRAQKAADPDVIREAALAEQRRNDEAVERERVRADEHRSLTVAMIDALKAVGERPAADVHVHVPDTVLNIGDQGTDDAPAS